VGILLWISLSLSSPPLSPRFARAKKKISLLSSRLREEKLVLREGARPSLVIISKSFFFFFFLLTGGGAPCSAERPETGFLGIFMCGSSKTRTKTTSFSKTHFAFRKHNARLTFEKVIDLSFVHFCVWISSSRDLSLSFFLSLFLLEPPCARLCL